MDLLPKLRSFVICQNWKKPGIERQISCRLQCKRSILSRGSYVTRWNLQAAICIGLKKIHVILAESRPTSILCNCCKPRNVGRYIAKRACYMLQPTCNLSCNPIVIQVEKKLTPHKISYSSTLSFFEFSDLKSTG